MGRIDRERLDAAQFPTMAEIPLRYDDVDSLNHVNNAAAAVILQEARVQFHAAAGFIRLPAGMHSIVAALSIEYAGEMLFPGSVEVSTGLLKVGRSSYVLGQVARQGGRPTLYAETALVITDDGGPAPIPEAMRAAYEKLLIVDR
jgi:acyl-CoA thioester hydrolase